MEELFHKIFAIKPISRIFRAKTSINKDIDKENIRKQDMDLYVKLHKSFCQKSDNMIKTTFFQLFSCSAEKKGV